MRRADAEAVGVCLAVTITAAGFAVVLFGGMAAWLGV